MTKESNTAYQGSKAAHIIMAIAEMYGPSLQEATEIYYESDTASMIEDGIADMHCRSDKYLATVIWEGHRNNNQNSVTP